MAVNRGSACLLLREHAKRPFRGSVLELGRQTISFNESQLRVWAEEAEVNLKSRTTASESDAGNMAGARGTIFDDDRFFHLLGFDEVASCDASRYENSTLIVDLNQLAEQHLHGRFDVIYNGGTMEHIFHVPNVLSNIHAMLKVGGRAIHIAPSSNLVDHGFYSFSPTFFCDYYEANNYDVLQISLFECFDWMTEWIVYDYSKGCLDDMWGKIATAKKIGVFCVAEKTIASTSHVIPSQSYYSRLWQSSPKGHLSGRNALLKQALKDHFSRLTEILYWTRSLFWRTRPWRRKFMPPRMARY
ncbi:MAG TPA: hypothetical protein VFF95_10310 [Candidatus Binatus sp.]|jgi:hypothetical protein|nr:hypothetical protein [Candidatus Binatus sp.]